MKKLEPYVNVATTSFLKKLSDMAGQELNMTKWAQLFAFGELFSFHTLSLLLSLFLRDGPFQF